MRNKYVNPKYGSPTDNPGYFYAQQENKINEARNGYVTEHNNAYNVLPDVERAKRKIKFYKVIRLISLILGILFVVAPIIAILVALPHVDAHAKWFEALLRICFVVFIVGIISLFICRAAHVDVGKCRLVILAQKDEKEQNSPSEE